MPEGARAFHYHIYDEGWQELDAHVIDEGSLTIFVNGQELATLMCTPRDPEQLALGFLANEGFISNLEEVEILHTCPSNSCVDIWLAHTAWDRPRRKIITTGCTGGVTFTEIAAKEEPLISDLHIDPQQLGNLFALLQSRDSLYALARGVHASALSDGESLLLAVEDVGRHNTLDRLRGECLRSGLDSRGLVLLTTGRVSSEMIVKGFKMGCPIVASRTSPTSISVEMARLWNITLCGYVRRNRMNVYAHPERLMRTGFEIRDVSYLPITEIHAMREE